MRADADATVEVDADAAVEVEVDAGDPDDGGTPPASGPAIETYRVLHWNIAGGKENDCRTGEIARAVVRYVRDRNIDFVGLNEVCPAQFTELRDRLRAYWGKSDTDRFAAYVGDGTARIVGNAIFSRLDLRDVTREKLGEDQYGDRNLLCARSGASHARTASTAAATRATPSTSRVTAPARAPTTAR